MNIFIYEPFGVKSGTGRNQSERFVTIMNELSQYTPIELRLKDIASEELKNRWLEKNDNDNTIIVAHYTDVEDHFNDLEKIENAIGIFHTYNSGWVRDKINHNEDVLRISNSINRFCCHSDSVKAKISEFVTQVYGGESALICFDILKGFDPKHEKLLEPFKTVSPLDDYLWKSKLTLAKEKLNEYLQKYNEPQT